MRTALTIAGSDSGGGAGIQADLKTFHQLGVFGASVVTAVTAQNTLGVRQSAALSPELVGAQLDAVLEDLGADAAKTGMLANARIVERVAEALQRHGVEKLVVDPVMVAKSGDVLLDDDGCEALARRILPLAWVLTPNLPEAARLLGREVRSIEQIEDMVSAAAELQNLGPRNVVVKGGHLSNPARATDVVRTERDETYLLESAWHPVGQAHGTGCTLSAALTAHLAQGRKVLEAAWAAKAYLSAALASSAKLSRGVALLNHAAARLGHDLVTLKLCV